MHNFCLCFQLGARFMINDRPYWPMNCSSAWHFLLLMDVLLTWIDFWNSWECETIQIRQS